MFRGSIIGATVLIALAVSAQAEPLDKPVEGPKLICFKYSTFSLDEGERVTDFSGSLEAISITVESPFGTYAVGESEIFAFPKDGKRLVFSTGRTSVYRMPGREQTFTYGG